MSDKVRDFVERDKALISAALDGDRRVLLRAAELIGNAGDGYEYAARWEYAGSDRWWPDHRGGFRTATEAREWPSTLTDLKVKNTSVLRRLRTSDDEWEQIEPT